MNSFDDTNVAGSRDWGWREVVAMVICAILGAIFAAQYGEKIVQSLGISSSSRLLLIHFLAWVVTASIVSTALGIVYTAYYAYQQQRLFDLVWLALAAVVVNLFCGCLIGFFAGILTALSAFGGSRGDATSVAWLFTFAPSAFASAVTIFGGLSLRLPKQRKR